MERDGRAMSDIFISYSRRYETIAQRFVGMLVARGREIWIDWEAIPPSAEWLSEVREAIEGTDAPYSQSALIR